ncbi:hypothetical protein BD309DRAFT_861188, partial [Dichomitus squalens]
VRKFKLRMGDLRSDSIGSCVANVVTHQNNGLCLATSSGTHVRLMSLSTGKRMNDFEGRASVSCIIPRVSGRRRPLLDMVGRRLAQRCRPKVLSIQTA